MARGDKDKFLEQVRRAAAAALGEFEASLPRRTRIAIGVSPVRGAPPEAAGDRQKAVRYFEKLVALSSKADTTRPELDHANAFLGRR